MSTFREDYGNKDDANQCQFTPNSHGSADCILVQQQKQEQKEEAKMDAQLHPKDSARENGQGPHIAATGELILYSKLDERYPEAVACA